MTDREFFAKVAEGIVDAEVIEKANAKIEALDARNAKVKDKKAAEHAETDAAVFEALTAEPQTASDIAAVTGFSTSKIAASCKRMGDRVAIGEMKNGSRTVKSYALA